MAAVALSWAFIMGIYGTILVFPTCTRQYDKFVRSSNIKDISLECQYAVNLNIVCDEKGAAPFRDYVVAQEDCETRYRIAEERHQDNLEDGSYFMPDDP
jgi:hypothetical protein